MKSVKEIVGKSVYLMWPTGATQEIERLEKQLENIQLLIKNTINTGNPVWLEKALEDNLENITVIAIQENK